MKKIVLLFIIYILTVPYLFSQENKSENTDNKVKIEKEEPKKDAIEEYNRRGETRPEETGSSFIPSMIVLILILFGLYYTLKLIRKKKVPEIKEVPYMDSIGTLMLPSGAYLEIVEIGDKIFILGVSNNSVSLIKEIEDKDLILKIKTNPPTIKTQTFINVLGKVFEKKGLNIDIKEPKTKFVEYLKKQKERLKKLK
jgi:flagellar biogenesis protein FliO